MNFRQTLAEVLKIISIIPHEQILQDLNVAPGWSYHGAFQQFENKLGPGRYDPPTIVIKQQDFLVPSNWFHYPMKPRYQVLCFLPSKPEVVIQNSLAKLERHYRIEKWVVEDIGKQKRIYVTTKDGEEFVGTAESLICASYSLYRAVWHEEQILGMPALKDLAEVVDINSDYEGEPTLIFKNMPGDFLKWGKFSKYFTLQPGPQHCVGKLKLVEGDFWVVTQKRYDSHSYKYRESNSADAGVHLGGILTRRGMV